ncbi:carboxypeptidase-like regulatory domain-containing protein [Calditrichota bacterium LG25]
MRLRFFQLTSLLLLFVLMSSCSSSYQLIGKVQDNSSNLIKEAVVVVKDLKRNDSTRTYTDYSGGFSVNKIKSPNVEVIIRAPEYLPLSRRMTLGEKVTYEFFELEKRPTIISGTVIDKNRKPVSNVQVIDGMGQLLGFTDEYGKFMIDKGFNPKLEVVLTFRKNGFKPTFRSIVPTLYKNNNLGMILLDSLPIYVNRTESGADKITQNDLETSQTVFGVNRSGRVNEFLKNRERFSFQDFADLLRQINANLTDERIMEQLEEMINSSKVKEEDGYYRSLIYQGD